MERPASATLLDRVSSPSTLARAFVSVAIVAAIGVTAGACVPGGGGPHSFTREDRSDERGRALELSTIGKIDFSRRPSRVDFNSVALAFAGDGTLLAVGDLNGKIQILDTSTWSSRNTLKGHEGRVCCLCFSADARMLASGGSDGTVRLWELATKKERYVVRPGARDVLDLVLSPSSTRLVGTLTAGGLWCYDLRTERVLPGLGDIVGGVRCVASCSDKCLTAVGLNDGRVMLFDAETGEIRGKLKQDHAPIDSLAFSAGGKRLATGTPRGWIHIWDILVKESGGVKMSFPGGGRSLSFDYSGQYLASATAESLLIWDIQAQRVVAESKGLRHPSIAFAPNANLLAATDGIRGIVLFRLIAR